MQEMREKDFHRRLKRLSLSEIRIGVFWNRAVIGFQGSASHCAPFFGDFSEKLVASSALISRNSMLELYEVINKEYTCEG